jgi:hypothetical protein
MRKCLFSLGLALCCCLFIPKNDTMIKGKDFPMRNRGRWYEKRIERRKTFAEASRRKKVTADGGSIKQTK